jgi:hypothetical protein
MTATDVLLRHFFKSDLSGKVVANVAEQGVRVEVERVNPFVRVLLDNLPTDRVRRFA